jgi:hypothetical protein
LRIVYAKPEKRTRRRLGVLLKALSGCDETEVDLLLAWFKVHLPLPPKDVFRGGRGLCWFKLDARACIERVRELASHLELRGERVWQVYSRNPGLITYEDDYQVVALPDSTRFE